MHLINPFATHYSELRTILETSISVSNQEMSWKKPGKHVYNPRNSAHEDKYGSSHTCEI